MQKQFKSVSNIFVKNPEDADYTNIPNYCGIFINGVEPEIVKVKTISGDTNVWVNNTEAQFLSGEYTWFTFENNNRKSYGFKYNPQKTFEIIQKDYGTKGQYGEVYSGRTVTLSDDGYVDIPLNFDSGTGTAQGSVIYWDENQSKFVQILGSDINLEFYRLENVTFGPLVRLWDRNFSNAEMQYINNDPLEIIKWGLNKTNKLLPKQENDWLFSITEDDLETLYEIQNETLTTLTIQGTYTRNKGSNKGLQSTQLVFNDLQIPIDISDSCEFHNYEYIKSNVIPNPLENSYQSMIVIFKYPKNNKTDGNYILNTTDSGSRIYFWVSNANYDSAEISTQFGNYNRTFTLSSNDPNVIHGIYYSYDKNTNTINWALDGSDFTSETGEFTSIIPDGIILGNSALSTTSNESFHGEIMEFIYSNDIITQDQWKEIWEKNKDTYYSVPCDGNIDCTDVLVCT